VTSVVLDINVFISGLLIRNGLPGRILDLWRQNLFDVFISEKILARMSQVLNYPKISKALDLDEARALDLINDIRTSCNLVSSEVIADVSSDPEDNTILSCAIHANVQFLVTGDKKHLLPLKKHKGVRIITPRDFVTTVEDKR